MITFIIPRIYPWLYSDCDISSWICMPCLKLYLLYLIIIVLRATGKISLLLLTVLPSWNKVITYLLTYLFSRWLYSADLIGWQCHVRQGHVQLSLCLVLHRKRIKMEENSIFSVFSNIQNVWSSVRLKIHPQFQASWQRRLSTLDMDNFN